MEKSILDDYFEKSEFKGRICDSPEEIEETLKINRHMREVVRDYRYRSAKSRELARGLILDRSRC